MWQQQFPKKIRRNSNKFEPEKEGRSTWRSSKPKREKGKKVIKLETPHVHGELKIGKGNFLSSTSCHSTSEMQKGSIKPPPHHHIPMMTHKYRGSQQSSREVKPKFIDSTQGEPKNIYKP